MEHDIPKFPFVRGNKLICAVPIFLGFLALQVGYYIYFIQRVSTINTDQVSDIVPESSGRGDNNTLPEMGREVAVVVYSGSIDRYVKGYQLTGRIKAQILVVSRADIQDIQRATKAAGVDGLNTKVVLEQNAKTTDQNARFTARILKSRGMKRAVLVTSWWHMPRAYFLPRLYLLGSGIHCGYCCASTIPAGWIENPDLHREFIKFWGSLGRVALSLIGIDHWPPINIMP
jgi:uncharacterized SAM-binding protein YcdF (DUF218 family)